MKRALIAAAVVLLAAPALAQEPSPENSGAAAWRFEARALDMTKMLLSGRRTPLPLQNATMDVSFDAPGGGDITMTTRTGEDGTFVLTGAEPPAGATLTFWVGGKQFGEGKTGYFARPVHLSDAAAPETVEFFEVALESHDLVLSQVTHVVSVINRDFENDDGPKEIMFRALSMLENRGPRVWLGDPRRDDGVSFGISIPKGFELRNATLDGQKIASSTGPIGHGGATGFVYRGPVFPSVGGPMAFQLMFAAPYEEGRVYDASWHTEHAVGRYMLNLQEDAYTYVPPDAGDTHNVLSDGGVNPPMGNLKVVTHMWGLASIPPHGNVSAKFLAGRPFPWEPILWVAAMVLMAVGAGVLGLAAARSSRKKADEVAVAESNVRVPTGDAAKARELELLDRRLKRGEITTIEHAIRTKAVKEALNVDDPEPPPRKPSAKKPTHAVGTEAALVADVKRIGARVDDADEKQLRDDVRTLVRAVQELLERR